MGHPNDKPPLDKNHRCEGESILEEAQRLTHGDRAEAYGPPEEQYKRVTAAFNAITGHSVSPAQGAIFMCLVKMDRDEVKEKRDNRTDLAGYAWVLDRCRQAEGSPKGTGSLKSTLPDYQRPQGVL